MWWTREYKYIAIIVMTLRIHSPLPVGEKLNINTYKICLFVESLNYK